VGARARPPAVGGVAVRDAKDGAGLELAAREGPAVVLRRADVADMAAVAAIEQTSFGDPWSLHAFTELLDDPRVSFLIADQGGAVRGYLVAWSILDEGEIGNLAVAASARRQGIGARLLDGAVDAARAEGILSLYLEVRDSNAAARALYASRGFVEIGRRRDYYRRPREDALVLRLQLARSQ
jgi:[ribosomal protein S18]-alanine N-acetyltransferase